MSILCMRKLREIKSLASNYLATKFATNLFDTQTYVLIITMQ